MSNPDVLDELLDSVYVKNVYSSSEKKKISSIIQVFMDEINLLLKKHAITASVFLGGSSAKGTFLKGSFDCDIFIRFDYDKYAPFTNELSDILEPLIEEVTSNSASRVHGSRDYFQYKPKKTGFDMMFEIIPVLEVTDPKKALNVTDMSPLHVLWIKKYLVKKPKLVREIIVTKLFLKTVELYGAESYIRGFSGHVVDILITYYGSFKQLITHAISWVEGEVIDIERHYSSKEKALSSLNESKLSPLILIDPVLKTRNAAASLSLEKFELFKEKALAFLSDPSKKYFVKKKFSLSKLQKKSITGTSKYLFIAEALEGKTDVVGSKLLKVYEYFLKRFSIYDFEVVDSGWYWDKQKTAYFWFFISDSSVRFVKKNPFIIHKGPPLHKKVHVLKFKEKNPKTFIEGKFICAKRKREFVTPVALIRNIINKAYIQERVKSFKRVRFSKKRY